MSDWNKAAEKLMAARCLLTITEPWYGHCTMSIEWKPSEMSWIENPADRTMGMAIKDPGIITGYYYPDWVLATPIERLYGVIEHSINHLIRLHTLRQRHLQQDAWNLATDMAVNGHKSNPYIGHKKGNKYTSPNDKMVWCPTDWPSTNSTEWYYEQMVDEEDENGQGEGDGEGEEQEQEGQGQGQGEGEGEGKSSSQWYESGKHSGVGVDNHQIWDETDVSQDDARQLVHDMARQATEKSRGHSPGHLTEILETLNKPIIKWREILRQYLGKHVGNKRQTWSRVNRRYGFGVKGISRHAAADVSVIIDTSGSISTQELEQFFGEIEAISYKAKVNVLQWDANFQGYNRYRRGDWRTMECKGRGGTNMVAPVDWLEQNNLIGDICIMLTDGYTPWPNSRPFPMLFVITTDETQATGPDWGEIVRMRIAQ